MSEYLDYLDSMLGSVYVYGAQGKELTAMTQAEAEDWIRRKETTLRPGYEANKAKYDANAELAISLYRQRLAAGMRPIYATDCSGLVMNFLQNKKHLVEADHSAKDIYRLLCDIKYDSLDQLRPGDPVFYAKNGKPSGIGHVGTYLGGGIVEEAKNQREGVVLTELKARPWNFAGHISLLDPYLVDEPVIFKLTTPRLRGLAVVDMQKALNSAGYTDDENKPLDADGVFGPRSAQAFDRLIKAHAAAPEPHVITICCTEPLTVSIDGEEAQIK